MTPTRRFNEHVLKIVRSTGIKVFIIPVRGTPWVYAEAAHRDHEAIINVFRDRGSDWFAYLLLHEMAHHLLGHTRVWTSTPHFMNEYVADQQALAIMKDLVDDDTRHLYVLAKRLARKNVRQWLRGGWIGDWMSHHVSLEIVRAAGIRLTKGTKRKLVEREEEWNRALTTSSTSTEQSQLRF